MGMDMIAKRFNFIEDDHLTVDLYRVSVIGFNWDQIDEFIAIRLDNLDDSQFILDVSTPGVSVAFVVVLGRTLSDPITAVVSTRIFAVLCSPDAFYYLIYAGDIGDGPHAKSMMTDLKSIDCINLTTGDLDLIATHGISGQDSFYPF